MSVTGFSPLPPDKKYMSSFDHPARTLLICPVVIGVVIWFGRRRPALCNHTKRGWKRLARSDQPKRTNLVDLPLKGILSLLRHAVWGLQPVLEHSTGQNTKTNRVSDTQLEKLLKNEFNLLQKLLSLPITAMKRPPFTDQMLWV